MKRRIACLVASFYIPHSPSLPLFLSLSPSALPAVGHLTAQGSGKGRVLFICILLSHSALLWLCLCLRITLFFIASLQLLCINLIAALSQSCQLADHFDGAIKVKYCATRFQFLLQFQLTNFLQPCATVEQQ